MTNEANPRPGQCPLAEAAASNAATFLGDQICAREGCGKPFKRRRGGKPQRYCSRRCRWLDWDANHPRTRP